MEPGQTITFPLEGIAPLITHICITMKEGAIWGIVTFILTALCSWWMIWRQRHIGWAPMILWAYIVTYSLYTVEYPAVPYAGINTAFMASSGRVLVEVLVIPLAVLSATDKLLDRVLLVMRGVMILEIFFVWFHMKGLMLAWSFDTALIALFLPFAPAWLWWLSIATILSHHGSTALLIVATQSLAVAIRRPFVRKWVAIVVPALVLIAYLHHNGPYFDSLERIQKYQKYMTFWLYGVGPENYSVLDPVCWWYVVMGVGPGSFIWISLILDHFKAPLFFCMHSDVLQILFELGFVGLTLSILTCWTAIGRSWWDTKKLAAVFGAMAFCLPYHPLRFPLSEILMAIIFVNATKRKA